MDRLLDFDTKPDALQSAPASCRICGRQEQSFVANVYGWPVYECRRCGVGFVWPQPSSGLLGLFYGPSYRANYLGSSEPLYLRKSYVEHECLRETQCVDRIMRKQHDARILDVGAGDGTLLRLLSDFGYSNLRGLELDEANAAWARRQLGVDIRACDFLDFAEDGWDAVLLWAVVEHLLDPPCFLRHAFGLLRPGGVCIVMTGDNSSAQAWVQGALDYWVYPPEHLFYFTRPSLKGLLAKAGFQGVRCRLQFQPVWKESILWTLRTWRAVRARLGNRKRGWRSVNSGVLVAWGHKPKTLLSRHDPGPHRSSR